MNFKYDDIVIRHKLLIKKGFFSLPDTGVFLLTGDNGTGKTLLLNYLHIEGPQTTTLVSQFSEVISNLSVIENISMDINLSENDSVLEFIHKYELEYLLKLKSGTMSGGEKRLVSFLRGVLSDSKIIFLDEPSNDLDYKITNKLLEMISDLSSDKLFLIVTHDKRFDSIKNGVLSIRNNELSLDVKSSNIKECDTKGLIQPIVYTDIENGNNVSIVKRIWNNRIVLLLILLLLSFLSNYMIWTVNAPVELSVDEIPSDQINIFLSVSQIGGSIYNEGSLQMTTAKKLTNSNLWFQSDSITNNESEDNEFKFDLNINKSDKFAIYPLEFFIPEEKTYIFTLDVYIEDIHKLSIDSNYVDISNIIYLPNYSQQGDELKFNPEEFEKAVQYIQKKHPTAKPVYYSVILNDYYNYDEFMFDNFSNYNNPNAYIQSNDIIALSNQLAEINTYRSTFNDMITCCAIFMIVELTYLLIYITAKSKSIRLLINYGFDRTLIKRKITRRNDNIFLRLIVMLMLLISTIILFINTSSTIVLAKHLPILCVFLFSYVGYVMEKVVLLLFMHHICSWKYRH